MSFRTSESLQEGAHMCIHMCERAAGWWRGKTLEYPWLPVCLSLTRFPTLAPLQVLSASGQDPTCWGT